MVALGVFLMVALFASSFGNADVVSLDDKDCAGGYIFVDKEVVMIEGPFNENCILQFETQEDRILAFTVVDGDMKEALRFFSIHDGLESDSPILLLENQKILEASRKNLPAALYTTQSGAEIRFLKAPTSNFQLKIQKAVICPFNLGVDSQCGRVVDETSCYCATFANRNQADQTMFCVDNKMKLISFGNATEEERVQAAWGTQTPFWTSLTDTRREGTWLWESSMTIPEYTNWYPGRPSSVASNTDDCMAYGGATFLTFWGDVNCATTMAHAVCEAQP
ncbi:uncharacterized protein LOC124197944 [Daphnia pulex]|uniref:uncharacterized protein LOC124197944 n=1 Tax=Daphnia pulex TaxID=6669 RepID=UPI001EDE145E|nr:uncharacterized protein LOC124197944 [Daphnia pulex]